MARSIKFSRLIQCFRCLKTGHGTPSLTRHDPDFGRIYDLRSDSFWRRLREGRRPRTEAKARAEWEDNLKGKSRRLYPEQMKIFFEIVLKKRFIAVWLKAVGHFCFKELVDFER